MHRTIPSGSSDERQAFEYNYQQKSSSGSSLASSVQRSASNGHARSAARPSTAINGDSSIAPHLSSNNTAKLSKPVNASPPRRRPSAPSSRSGSVSGVRDGIGNLNRWSQSTTSSKDSHSHKRSNSFSRRISFGGSGGFKFSTQDAPTTKLPKSRPSGGDSPTRLQSSGRPFDSSANPGLSLPPIITLPPLRADNEGPSPLTANTNTPSTAQILSAAVHATVPDYFGKAWEDSQQKETKQPRQPLQSLSPLDHPYHPSSLIPTSSLSASPSRTHSSSGHSRHRSGAGGNSGETPISERNKSKDRSSKQPSQKAMLSKALQKANTAVLLDNAQNFEGAMQAYSEACNLLQQVMQRSSGDEDRRKLEAIRSTYTSRIRELEKIAPHLMDDGKALPARPASNHGSYRSDDPNSPQSDEIDSGVIETAIVARIVNDESYNSDEQSRQLLPSQLPKRRESLAPAKSFDKLPPRNVFEHYREQKASRKYPGNEAVLDNQSLAPTSEKSTMLPPASPRKLASLSAQPHYTTESNRLPHEDESSREQEPAKGHTRAASTESMSWLDTIDESGGSTASSVHSRTSSLRVRRKHIRAASGATEAEFDAALDAAVEAAYDEGFEPEQPYNPPIIDDYDNDIVINVRRKVELAKERVRQTERETAIQLAKDRERMRALQEKRDRDQSYEDYDGNESEEEERMLEEMTRGYVMDDFEFGLQAKSALPRESDSSGFSGRTWNSSIGSNPTTAGTTLSTVAEKFPEMPPLVSGVSAPFHPPPSQALPRPPSAPAPLSQNPSLPAMNSAANGSNQSVRSRRLSGQNAKQLKIETVTRAATPPSLPPSMPPPKAPQTAGAVSQTRAIPPPSSRPPVPQSARQASSPFPGPNPPEVVTPPTPTLDQIIQDNEAGNHASGSGSPVRPQSRSGLKKNFSSSSLKNMKSRNLSVSMPDDSSDMSPNTPMSNGFSVSPASREPPQRLPAIPALPTAIASAFKDKMNGTQAGGMFLFDSDLASPGSSVSSGAANASAPIPLEPCPKEFLLRPFWLMRALYQTIAHPRGGYLSTKLFVPKDVWRVKGVKLKGVEDKIANCDFLTAALQKLSRVDTYDADLVLDEMQALETVLEQVQAALTKKLGNEVGVANSGLLFKDATSVGETDNNASGSKTPTANKSSFSWRRLRSKNSGVGLSNAYSGKTATPAAADISKDNVTMATLPMTSLPNPRFAKRDVASVQFSGPNANYMAALARLFDAAQVVDQIARQVEDPGLRHADKTQVGLELSTRHAAEFFGFYICRFVLADVNLLLDKFIKRGSEWVVV